MKHIGIKSVSKWIVVLICLFGVSCLTLGIVSANTRYPMEGAFVLSYEIENLPVERLSERDAVDSEGTLYGLLSTNGGYLVHYCGHYNAVENKCVLSTDASGEPQITGSRLLLDDAEIVFENGAHVSEWDLKPGTPVLVESDYTLETYPAQIHCTKIVVLE